MNSLKVLLKKDISLVHGAISNTKAKSMLKTYQVLESFTHFYENHSHIFLVGKDICAVMAKHFPYFNLKTRDNTKVRYHSIGDGALSTLLNTLRREYRVNVYFTAATFATKPEYKKSQVSSPVSYLIDEVMSRSLPKAQDPLIHKKPSFLNLFD